VLVWWEEIDKYKQVYTSLFGIDHETIKLERIKENQMKRFVCKETGEEIIVQKTKNKDYNDIRNMSLNELTNILNWVDDSILLKAMERVMNEKTNRFIKICQVVHGRMYAVLKKAEW
jgi:hypothetical protein